MEIDKKLVKKIASLSKIKIDENEVEKFSKELSKIISWIEKLNEVNPELIVLAGYMKLIPSDITSIYEKKIINIHPFFIFFSIITNHAKSNKIYASIYYSLHKLTI